MGLVVPSEGELELLDKMLKDALSVNENYILKLFSNAQTPADTSTATSFTEANFTNYAARTLTRSGWSAGYASTSKAESSYGSGPSSWTCGTTGNTIYGYYVVGSSTAKVLWAEKFATARVLAESDILNITPKFTLMSES